MTFGQKVPKLNSRPVYCSRLYGIRNRSNSSPFHFKSRFNSNNLFLRSTRDFKLLKVGTHEYFGLTIETTPIRTMFALCYKVESKSKLGYDTSMIFSVPNQNREVSKNDKLESIKLYVAANNTWQGVIFREWPNTKNPLKVIGKFSSDSHNFYYVPIEVTERSHLKGNVDYSQCIDQKEFIGESCKSIFHPNSYKYEDKNKYLYIPIS